MKKISPNKGRFPHRDALGKRDVHRIFHILINIPLNPPLIRGTFTLNIHQKNSG